MSATAIRVLIVDDHPLVREGVRQALAVPGFDVVGEAGSGPEGLEQARRLRPDVVILDITLPGETGLSIAPKLLGELPQTRLLMLSVHDNAEYVLGAVRAGAHGYLRKDSLPDVLRRAIQTVHSGGTCFGTALDRTPETLAPILPTTASQRLGLLTKREREVLIGIANGRANKEIAGDLGLSVRTVESYRESLVRKLGIPSVAGLTRLAIEARLVGG